MGGGGGKGGGGSKQLNWMSQVLFDRGSALYKLGKPHRKMLADLLMDALRGGNQLESIYFNPIAKQIESQTGESRRRLMETLPQGGVLDRSLGDLERSRLGTRATAQTQVRQSLLEEAFNTAFGRTLNPSLGFGGAGMQGAAQSAQMQAQANAERNRAMMGLLSQGIQGVGQGIGAMEWAKIFSGGGGPGGGGQTTGQPGIAERMRF